MLKSGLAFAAAAYLVSPFGPFPLTKNDDPNGHWTAEVRHGDCGERESDESLCVQMTLKRGSRVNRSSWGFTVPAGELTGIKVTSTRFDVAKTHFELKREAGTLSFEGDFERGEGEGEFVFISNPGYVAQLNRSGYGRASESDLMALAIHDVPAARLTDFAKRGYAKGGVDDIIAFAIHGVDPDMIDELTALGYEHPSADELVALQIHGVTPDYAKEMQHNGRRPSLDELVAMKIHGVDRGLKRALADAEIEDYDDDDLVALKVHGVDLDLAKTLKGLDLSANVEDLVALTVQGVNPEFITRMVSAGLGDLDIDNLVSLKVQGVDPEFVREMTATGLKGLDADQLVAAKVQGIDPRWVRDMVRSGIDNLDLEDLIGAKVQGIDGEFVKSMRDAGLKGADLDELIGLKVQGIDPAFVRRYLDREPDADVDDIASAWHSRNSRRHREY